MTKTNDVLKQDWPILILLLLGFVLGAYFYPSLPDQVPIHWNAAGEIDGYGSKAFGAFGLPGITAAIYVLFLILPKIDPKRKSYTSFQGPYQMTKYILVIFLLGIQILTILVSIGVAVNMPLIIQIAVALLFILIGNVMGRFKHNYFVGIKTPWTLANEEVWRKTHRMAAPLWVLGGLLYIVLTIWGSQYVWWGLIGIVAVIAVVPMIYSYVVYRRIVEE